MAIRTNCPDKPTQEFAQPQQQVQLSCRPCMNEISVPAPDHETSTIRVFVQKNKQERFLGLLANPKHRRKFTKSLPHFCWFDQRFATPISWKVDPKLALWEKHLQGIENVYRLLKSKGAGLTCWVISEDTDIDGRELDLRAALEKVVGNDMGTIVSCVPGKLAYFEGEDEALLLAR